MSAPRKAIQCAVCNKDLHSPCTLECFHTFCRKCVVGFTQTQPEAISAQSVSCPFCQRLTRVPDPDRPVEDWAVQVRPSFVIQGIVMSADSDDTGEVPCDLCSEEGERVAAGAKCSICDVTLCKACLKAHKRNPASRRHDITDISEHIAKPNHRLICPEHQDERIHFYCKECRKPLCHSCCKLCHNNCKTITPLESLKQEIQISLQDNKDVLTAITGNQTAKVDELKTKYEKLVSLNSTIKSQITSACQHIYDIIKAKERKLLEKLDDVTGKSLGKLEADIQQAEMSRKMSQQRSDIIDYVLQSQNETDMFETFLSCETGVVQLVDGLVTETEDTYVLSSITLIQDMGKVNKAVEELDLGQFEVQYESRSGGLEITSFSQGATDLRVTGDECQASPTDVITMEVNGETVTVVTDWGTNKSVKSFYTRNGRSCHSWLSFPEGPYSLSHLIQKEVVVTIPASKQIVRLEVNPDLKLISSIATKKEYWGVTSVTPFRLAAGSQSPSCVDILDMTGAILRTLRPHNKDGLLIKYPNFLCTTKNGDILVSDCGTKSVFCLTPEGEVVFSCVPTGDRALKSPRGITRSTKGDILVADFSLHNILHLTESGLFVRNVLTAEDNLQYPHGLFLDEHNVMHVSLYSEGSLKAFQCNTK